MEDALTIAFVWEYFFGNRAANCFRVADPYSRNEYRVWNGKMELYFSLCLSNLLH